MEGEYGLMNIHFGKFCKLHRNEIEQMIETPLNEEGKLWS